MEVEYQHGHLYPTTEASLPRRVPGEVAILNGKVMVTLVAADVEIGSTPERGGKILHKRAVLDGCADILNRLVNEDAQTTTSAEVVVVVESKVDLLAGVLLRKKRTVVPKLAAGDVNQRLVGDGG